MLRLDQKLQNIREGRYKRSDFIIADAKDSDAGAGITCSGFDYTDPSGQARRRTRRRVPRSNRGDREAGHRRHHVGLCIQP